MISRCEKWPQTPVQGSGAHEPLLSREATSHSLTAMLVWSCRLKMWTQKVRHVRETRVKKHTKKQMIIVGRLIEKTIFITGSPCTFTSIRKKPNMFKSVRSYARPALRCQKLLAKKHLISTAWTKGK